MVFDCDGVLVDSEPHSVAAWMEVLGGLGHPASEDEVASCTGLGFLPTWEFLRSKGALPPPEEVWPHLLSGLARSFEEKGLRVFGDAVAVLDACDDAGLQVAVVSASPRDRLELTLGVAELSRRFAVSVAGDEVERGKPAPDAYLAAAAGLGVAVEESVALEDSVAGAGAALEAGMAVIAVVREEATREALAATGAIVVDRLTPEVVGL